MSNPFFANMKNQMKEKGKDSVLAAIAPSASSTVAVAEEAVASAASAKEECALLPIPVQPKAGKEIVLPVYDSETQKVKCLGIRLSLAPDNVPCAYYRHNKRLIMGVTLMHALDEQGEVQNIPCNVKEKSKQAMIEQAQVAVREAFAAHRNDADLTHAKLLTYANLYDGATFLRINYQTYERTINDLLGATPPVAPRKARNVSTKKGSAVEEDADPDADAEEEEDEDAGLISGISRKEKEPSMLDGDMLALAEELGLNEEDEETFRTALPLDMEEEEEVIAAPLPPPVAVVKKAAASTPSVCAAVKRSAPSMPAASKKSKNALDATFVRAVLYKILINDNTSDERLWKALQSESLDCYFIDQIEKELKEKKSTLNRDFLMAKLFSMLRSVAGKPEDELWSLTGRIPGL